MSKNLVFRIRKKYFDAIVQGKKMIEYRRDSTFWRARVSNLLPWKGHRLDINEGLSFSESRPVVGVFVCGKQIHRRQIVYVEKQETPKNFSMQGKKDVDTPYCFAFHLGKEVDKE